MLESGPNWIDLVEDTEADFILWPHLRNRGQTKLQELLATGRWQPVYRDSVSWLLARNAVPLPVERKVSPATPWRDLSVAQIAHWSGQQETAVNYAEKVREQIPWHQRACNLLVEAHRKRGDEARAGEVSRECRAQFPSPMLL